MRPPDHKKYARIGMAKAYKNTLEDFQKLYKWRPKPKSRHASRGSLKKSKRGFKKELGNLFHVDFSHITPLGSRTLLVTGLAAAMDLAL